jgi:regulator of sigma E protease
MITAMTLKGTLPNKKEMKPITFKFDGKTEGWPYAFFRLQAPAEFPLPPGATIDRAVEITTDQSARPITLVPEPDPTWFCPLRGLRFEWLKTPLPPLDFTGALRRGGRETLENVMAIYYMFRGLAQQRLSEKNFAGPIRIVGMAYSFASAGLAPFLYFLGLLSVNLAVLNFLPIPPLDGGQMAFLLAERVRGRPVPETAQAAGTYAGLLLVLGLMVLFLYQDVLSFFP